MTGIVTEMTGGIHPSGSLDSRLRGNDRSSLDSTRLEFYCFGVTCEMKHSINNAGTT